LVLDVLSGEAPNGPAVVYEIKEFHRDAACQERDHLLLTIDGRGEIHELLRVQYVLQPSSPRSCLIDGARHPVVLSAEPDQGIRALLGAGPLVAFRIRRAVIPGVRTFLADELLRARIIG